MTQDKAGLGEQTLNKLAEMALASQLGIVEELKVQIKTDLSKLSRGEVDFIAININGLIIQKFLPSEELQIEINRISVKPRLALIGKIKLTKPSQGTLRVVISEENLTHAFNSESFQKHLHQSKIFIENRKLSIHIQKVNFSLLADGNIALKSELILDKTGQVQQLAFTATPLIGADGQEIVLQDVNYLEGKELPPQLTDVLVAQVSEVLSLRDFDKKGMSRQFQQIDVVAGKLTLQAAIHIEQIPSS